MESPLFAAVCSIATTKRRRFFWAAWWTAPPCEVPFRAPDAADGGAATWDDAVRAAEGRAARSLQIVDGRWARAVLRTLRGEHPWPSEASRRPQAPRAPTPDETSIWATLGVPRDVDVTALKAAYRQRARETHPDHGGTEAEFRRVVRAYAEATRRLERPRRKR